MLVFLFRLITFPKKSLRFLFWQEVINCWKMSTSKKWSSVKMPLFYIQHLELSAEFSISKLSAWVARVQKNASLSPKKIFSQLKLLHFSTCTSFVLYGSHLTKKPYWYLFNMPIHYFIIPSNNSGSLDSIQTLPSAHKSFFFYSVC